MPSTRKKLADKKSKLASPLKPSQDHPANLDAFQEGSFYKIEIHLIKPNPHQPRQHFDPETLKELANSIKQKGVLQPIIIRRDDENIYLVAGERRLRAAKQANLTHIPAILTTGNPMEISLIENLQRENLKPVEEAEALHRMMKKYSYTQDHLAKVVGKARTTITEVLSLNKLPEEIKETCRETDAYPKRLLVEVAKLKTPEAMLTLFKQIQEGHLKSDQARQLARKKDRQPHRTKTDILQAKTRDLTTSLSKLDLKSIKAEERRRIKDVLQTLKTTIENLLK